MMAQGPSLAEALEPINPVMEQGLTEVSEPTLWENIKAHAGQFAGRFLLATAVITGPVAVMEVMHAQPAAADCHEVNNDLVCDTGGGGSSPTTAPRQSTSTTVRYSTPTTVRRTTVTTARAAAPVTEAPTTAVPTTEVPTTTTEAPTTTEVPTTVVPTTVAETPRNELTTVRKHNETNKAPWVGGLGIAALAGLGVAFTRRYRHHHTPTTPTPTAI